MSSSGGVLDTIRCRFRTNGYMKVEVECISKDLPVIKDDANLKVARSNATVRASCEDEVSSREPELTVGHSHTHSEHELTVDR